MHVCHTYLVSKNNMVLTHHHDTRSFSFPPSLSLSLFSSPPSICTLTQVNWGTTIHTNMSLAMLQSFVLFLNRIEISRKEYLNFIKSWLGRQTQK